MFDKDLIRNRILELVSVDSKRLSSRLVAEFGMSRQSANNHIASLVEAGSLIPSGQARGREYRLAVLASDSRRYPRDGLKEDRVSREFFQPFLGGLPPNVQSIWQYGTSEMVNNAIDHSGSEDVVVGLRRTGLYTDGWVVDRGEGIFVKIQKSLGLYDPRESILELAKGKLTTSPENHSGEGIFFTSKVFDRFDIVSGRLHFLHDGNPLDFMFERDEDSPGTAVLMRLSNTSTRTTKEIMDQFAAPEEFNFAKTIVPVRLALYEGEKLLSRSQAKRLSLRFERFANVVLDFSGVDEIGQAFSDELFRVFAKAHPSVVLAPINTVADVAAMIERAKTGSR
jgi:anti-sigma regulatory factor (Ser/Thr protein kinase)/biotin operon repressor